MKKHCALQHVASNEPRKRKAHRACPPVWFLGLILVAAPWAATPASADGKVDFDAAALFSWSCAPCHGSTGAGDGPVAGALKQRPKPLTGLSAAHGGQFPADYVRSTIDGRILVDAHGPRQMPIWGKYFVLMQKNVEGQKQTLTSRESNAATVVNALVQYVKSLQKP